jgi:hypothetical protein
LLALPPVKQETVAVPKRTIEITENSTDLRLKAEASRMLASISDDAERKAVLGQRAREWDRLAAQADKHKPSNATSS